MARYRRQLELFGDGKWTNEHGGSLAIGKRKAARPIATKRAMHLTLKSELAVGKLAFTERKTRQFINELVEKLSKETFVRAYDVGIETNHVHMLVRAKTREGYRSFVRQLSGRIAQFVTGARKGRPFGRFWSYLVYTVIVEWGRHYRNVKRYVRQNLLEGLGVIPRQPRKKKAKPTPSLRGAKRRSNLSRVGKVASSLRSSQ